MKRLLSFTFIALLLLATRYAQAAEPDASTQAVFKNLMMATIANDHAKFIADCDDSMKAITPEKLEGVSKQLEPRSKGGYDSNYLGELKQRGYAVHVWRLRFKDGGDDILATLSMKDGKVGGFYLH